MGKSRRADSLSFGMPAESHREYTSIASRRVISSKHESSRSSDRERGPHDCKFHANAGSESSCGMWSRVASLGCASHEGSTQQARRCENRVPCRISATGFPAPVVGSSAQIRENPYTLPAISVSALESRRSTNSPPPSQAA